MAQIKAKNKDGKGELEIRGKGAEVLSLWLRLTEAIAKQMCAGSDDDKKEVMINMTLILIDTFKLDKYAEAKQNESAELS